MRRFLRPLVLVAVMAMSSCPSDETTEDRPSEDNPRTLASGQIPGSGTILNKRWELVAYYEADGDLCLSIEESDGSKSKHCSPKNVLGTFLPGTSISVQVDYSETTSWAYGWAAKDVRTVQIKSKGRAPYDAPVREAGLPFSFYVVQMSPRLTSHPVVLALDTAGKVVDQNPHPGFTGCASCIPADARRRT